MIRNRNWRSGAASAALFLLAVGAAHGQDRLKTMPGYAQFEKAQQSFYRSFFRGGLRVVWTDGGRAFGYDKEDKHYRYDIARRKADEVANAVEGERPTRRGQGEFRDRGRQFKTAASPDGRRVAFYRDRNLWIKNADGSDETAITNDGSVATRIKYATASWVYGEELDQATAMWWSPDSKKIAFYRFDESKVPDFYLALHTLDVQDTLDTEAYPKAGAPNPIADLLIYDLDSKQTTRVNVRDDKPFTDEVIGHYVYDIDWSPDGTELLFNRTNRLQNVMEFCAANPQSGAVRTIVRETSPGSWTENRPAKRFLADGKRFIFASERSGYRNFYLYDLSGKQIATLTRHPFDVESIQAVDEKSNTLYYMARSSDDIHRFQLHRVKLDGTGGTRLTDPAFNHIVSLAPDFKHFIDTAQTFDTPPSTRLMDMGGRQIAVVDAGETVPRSDRVERFTYKAADGVTNLTGMLFKPSNFDPGRKYPVLVDVYAGPQSGGAPDRFMRPNPLTEFGFLVAEFEGRGTDGHGKRFKDAIYRKMGLTEIDDQAAGVKYLRQRPYVDGAHVGIFGTSYGGYASLMCLLRYPDVFQAASCSSSPTDWRNYDSIYTERYMGLPQTNKADYDAGAAVTYAKNLKGRLLLYYGTADNNVHPNNTMQIIRGLQDAEKSFEVQVGPDQGHSAVNEARMMEFFIESLMPTAFPTTASR